MSNTPTREHANVAEYQRLCGLVREQQEIVDSLGNKALKLVTEKRWESALTPEEIRISKREYTEAAEDHMAEQEMLEAMLNALKIAGERMLAALWAGGQSAVIAAEQESLVT